MWSALGNEPLKESPQWVAPPYERGTWDILISCIFTLILCAWTAVHTNIPGPPDRDTRAQKSPQSRRSAPQATWQAGFPWKRTGFLLLAVVLPEVVAFVAYSQWRKQRKVTKEMKSIFETQRTVEPLESVTIDGSEPQSVSHTSPRASQETQSPSHASPRSSQETQSPSHASRRASQEPQSSSPPRQHEWTTTHSFYAVMGGFVIEQDNAHDFPIPNGHQRLTLSTRAIRYLARKCPEAIPDLKETEITDKSKSDALAKFLVCTQVTWFCANMIGRLVEGMPLTVLELSTAAHGICALLTYAFWWNKPLDITEPTAIRITDQSAVILARMCIVSPVGRAIRCDVEAQALSTWYGKLWLKLTRPAFYVELTDEHMRTADSWLQPICESRKLPNAEPGTTDSPYLEQVFARSYWFRGRPGQISLFRPSRKAYPRRRRPREKKWFQLLTIRDPQALYSLIKVACPNITTQGQRRFRLEDSEEDSKENEYMYSGEYKAPLKWSSNKELWLQPAASDIQGQYFENSAGGLISPGLLLACGLYAGIHAAGWNGPFRTAAEKYLWRLSVLAYAPFPVWMMLVVLSLEVSERLVRHQKLARSTSEMMIGLMTVLLPFCALAFLVGRTFLVVEAFLALAYSPDGSFKVPNWSTYFPHFG